MRCFLAISISEETPPAKARHRSIANHHLRLIAYSCPVTAIPPFEGLIGLELELEVRREVVERAVSTPNVGRGYNGLSDVLFSDWNRLA